MDNITLKKKLSTYESDKGYLKNVSDEVPYEVLVAWENWVGPSADFYRSLGFSHSQMAGIIGKASWHRKTLSRKHQLYAKSSQILISMSDLIFWVLRLAPGSRRTNMGSTS